jgi:hypothetical protein
MGRDNSEDLGVDGTIILKLILEKDVGKLWTGSEQGPVSGSCEHRNEPSGSIKGGKFVD